MNRLAALAWTFFSISALTPGGGMAMLPIMQREFVERRRWLSAEEMADVVAVMHSLPGLIAVNMAVLIGYRVKGVWGAVVAAFAAVLAPFAAIVLLATGRSFLSESPTLDHIFLGVRAAVAALILLSVLKLGREILRDCFAWILAVGSVVASLFFGVDVTILILVGAAVGLLKLVFSAVRRGRSAA